MSKQTYNNIDLFAIDSDIDTLSNYFNQEVTPKTIYDGDSVTSIITTIKNNMANGKLYVYCNFELKDEAKALGLKFDGTAKMWYMNKYTRKENVEKLYNLKKTFTNKNGKNRETNIRVPYYIPIHEYKGKDFFNPFCYENDKQSLEDILKLLYPPQPKKYILDKNGEPVELNLTKFNLSFSS